MKKNNYLKYTAGFLVTAAFTALVACGNSGNKNNPQPAVQPVYPNCVNCQNIGGNTFFTAQSQDEYNIFQLNWNFIGQNVAAQANTGYTLYNSPIISYTGPVGVQGQLSVVQGMNLGSCQLPTGVYSLATLSAGQWSAGIVYNLRMQANGPAVLIMTLTTGQVAAKTGAQLGQTWSEVNPVGRIFGNLLIESVNGYQCQMSVLVQ